jgi:pimeloyl-ACP methyl ester carboxylesterase
VPVERDRSKDHPSFVTHDGTRLARKELGSIASPSALVFVNGLFCVDGYWQPLWRELWAEHRILGFDHRGHGHSDPPSDLARTRIEDLADDVLALLDDRELERPVLFGFSLGVQILLELWRRHPERVRALVLVNGPYENPLSTLYGLHIPAERWERLLPILYGRVPRLTRTLWHAAFHAPWVHQAATLLGGTRADASDMRHFYDHQRRVDVPTGLAIAHAAVRHSARDVLPTITVPTLVIAGGRDTFAPLALSEVLRDEIPGARSLFLPRGTHTTLLEHPEEIARAVRRFLAELP